jgi:tetratricopeptide (TPR) repeat protein
LIILVAVFFGYHQNVAQVSKLSTNSYRGVYTIKGDYYFDHHNFSTAINNYSKAVNQNAKDTHAVIRLAEVYYQLNNYDLANNWFGKAFNTNPDLEEASLLNYVSVLHKLKKHEELMHWIAIYNEKIRKKYASNSAVNQVYRDSTLEGNELYKIYTPLAKTKSINEANVKNSNAEELFIYTSDGDEIKLSGKHKGNLEFDFVPGIRYTLIMELDNYRTGAIKTSTKTDLPKRNTYTFHIQKSDGVVYEQKDRSSKVQDIHINPGDLITFQLVPNKSTLDYEADDTRIRLDRNEARVPSNATIAFSYVAEGAPETSDADNNLPVAGLNVTGKDDLSNNDDVIMETAVAGSLASSKRMAIAQDISASSSESDRSTLTHLMENHGEEREEQIEDSPAPTRDYEDDIRKNNDDFYFRVQIAASKIKISDIQLKTIYGGIKETRFFKEDGLYKYYIEETFSYPNAKQVLKESGVQNAFIVAYKGNTKWNLNEAIGIQKNESTRLSNEAKTVNPIEADQKGEPNSAVTKNDQGNSLNALATVHEGGGNGEENNDFQFRVQIAASKVKLSEAKLKIIYTELKEIHVFKEDGYYKYYIEETPSYNVARERLKESKISNAFIVAYKNGKKWPLQDAIDFKHKTSYVK